MAGIADRVARLRLAYPGQPKDTIKDLFHSAITEPTERIPVRCGHST